MAGPVLERRNYKIWGCFQQGLLMWGPRNGLAYICIFAHLKAASPQTRAPLFDPRTSLHSSFSGFTTPPHPNHSNSHNLDHALCHSNHFLHHRHCSCNRSYIVNNATSKNVEIILDKAFPHHCQGGILTIFIRQ